MTRGTALGGTWERRRTKPADDSGAVKESGRAPPFPPSSNPFETFVHECCGYKLITVPSDAASILTETPGIRNLDSWTF